MVLVTEMNIDQILFDPNRSYNRSNLQCADKHHRRFVTEDVRLI